MVTQRLTLLAALGAGAGLMYILDPDRGRSRRARARDKAFHLARRGQGALLVAGRDLLHRSRGLAAQVQTGIFHRDDLISDDVLIARVRTRLGREVSHPHALQVLCQDGRIVLRGLILESEVPKLLAVVRDVPGVHQIDNQLQVRQRAEKVPGLQGGRRRDRSLRLLNNWSPAARFLFGTASAVLGTSVFKRLRERAA